MCKTDGELTFKFGSLYDDDIVTCSKCGSDEGYFDFCGYSMDVDGVDFECDCCTSCRNECLSDI